MEENQSEFEKATNRYWQYTREEIVQRHLQYLKELRGRQYDKISFQDGVSARIIDLIVKDTYAMTVADSYQFATIIKLHQERKENNNREGYLLLEPELIHEALKPYRYEATLQSKCAIGDDVESLLTLVWFDYADSNPIHTLSSLAKTIQWKEHARGWEL